MATADTIPGTPGIPETQARAVVTLLVEVELTQPWSETATVAEIYKVAERDAKSTIDSVHNAGSHSVGRRVRVRQVVRVDAVIAPRRGDA